MFFMINVSSTTLYIYIVVVKGELTNFFIFVFLRSSIINFTPIKKISLQNVFNLIKSEIVFS